MYERQRHVYLLLVFVVALGTLSTLTEWGSLIGMRKKPPIVVASVVEPQMKPVQMVPKMRLKTDILNTLTEGDHWQYPAVDAVYTWVNGSDPAWQEAKKKRHLHFMAKLTGKSLTDVEMDMRREKGGGSNGDNRYREHDELVFSLRSLMKNAPWIRHIHLVVYDGQRPSWLKEDLRDSKIKIVSHSEIFTNPDHLPVFSSRAIESQLNNIPGLSDYFLYFNDDFFLGQPVEPSDFFVSPYDGNQKLYFDSWTAFRECNQGCLFWMMGNGKCDPACRAPRCNFDMGDCGSTVMKDGWKEYDLDQKNRTFGPNSGDFLSSLKYVDLVYNRHLGKCPLGKQRPPVAHIPYFINKRLLGDAKQRFHQEFDLTASHPFRHQQDMQLSFSYNHYFIHSKVYAPTEQQIWRSALLSVQNGEEFLYRGLLNKENVYEHARKDWIEKTDSFTTLKDCAHRLMKDQEVKIPLCEDAVQKLHSVYQIRLPIERFQQQNVNGIYAFEMLNDNPIRSLKILTKTAKAPKKFVCIDDDMKRSFPQVDKAYLKMYQTLFPNASNFEV